LEGLKSQILRGGGKRITVQSQLWENHETLSEQQTIRKKEREGGREGERERRKEGLGCMAQVVKHLPSKHEAMNSNPIIIPLQNVLILKEK
jgi:hypothetical protein